MQAEIASIYQDEEERELNRPRRKAVPNPALELDMERYKLKIERKFNESYINANFRMPRIKTKSVLTKPNNLQFGKGDVDTALILQQRCQSQLDAPSSGINPFQISKTKEGMAISPASTMLM